jgi:preprotein translocase subunit SecY
MKHCPAADCPFARRHKRAAEYQDIAVRCSDCDGTLADGPAPPPPAADRKARRHGAPWRRLAISLAVPAALWAASQVVLPGVDLDRQPYYWRSTDSVPRSTVSIVALGILPFLSAAVLVELVALLVPGWRELRIRGPEGRRKLARATLILGIVVATVQGFLVTRTIEAYGIAEGGLSFRLTATTTMVAASCAIVMCTWLIDRHGLGNGFSIVIAASVGPALWDLGRVFTYGLYGETLTLFSLLVVLATLGLLVVATIMVLDAHRGWLAFLPGRTPLRRIALRLPASGLAPLELALVLLGLPMMIATYTPLDVTLAHKISPGGAAFVIAEIFLIIGGTLLFTWLFNRGAERALRTQIPTAWVRSALYLSLLTLGITFLRLTMHIAMPLQATMLAVATAVTMDLVAEWRAWQAHADLVAVWPIHRVYTLDAAVGALERAGIFTYPRGAHHRTLLQFFGPFVPITLMVPSARADEADRILRQAVGASGAT